MKASERLQLVPRPAAGIALAGGALCALGWWTVPADFYAAYLVAFLFWSGLSLGCAGILMIYHLVGGSWGFVSRRILEAGTWPLLLLPLGAIPLYWGIDHLYAWAHPAADHHDAVLAAKASYLNVPFFLARSALYLLLWAAGAAILCGSSSPREEDGPSTTEPSRRLQITSAFGLLVYVLSATFAAIDWMMSLEPHWFSAIYGLVVIAGQGVAGLALGIALLVWFRDDSRVREAVGGPVLRDLGSLLLAAVTFWMYVTFSQFLIIWSGNLPEEIPWYLARTSGGWKMVAGGLVWLHFGLPFVLLLSPRVKRRPQWLGPVAVLLLLAHYLDLWWLIMPVFRRTAGFHWLDANCLLTLGALWIFAAAWRLGRTGLLPAFSEHSREKHHGSVEAFGSAL